MFLSTSFMPKRALLAVVSLGLLSSCIHKKYETPITKNTQQPDKVLFDQAMRDIEHGRYEVARISLQTLMNTYESSEFLAKAKLAIADSWFREGGANGLGQAEAEYKDFELFYPQMEESAQAQSRVCDIHYKQMDRADRDELQIVAAETACKDLVTQYPNSKFVPAGLQKIRDIQELMAEHEFAVGNFYWRREMNPAAANRLNALVDQYPLYSKAGESLFEAGDAYSKMGPRFRKDSGEAFARIVRDYPLDPRAKDAKDRLTELEMPIPAADAAALKREQWEKENFHKPGMVGKSMGIVKGGADVTHSAKSGAPTMTDPKRTMPASIPVVNNAEVAANGTPAAGNTDVSATVSPTGGAIDQKPDARTPEGGAPAAAPAATTPEAATPVPSQAAQAQATSNAPLPTNRDKDIAKMRELQAKKQAKLNKKKKKGTDTAPAAITPDPAAATPGTPAAATPPTPPKP